MSAWCSVVLVTSDERGCPSRRLAPTPTCPDLDGRFFPHHTLGNYPFESIFSFSFALNSLNRSKSRATRQHTPIPADTPAKNAETATKIAADNGTVIEFSCFCTKVDSKG